MKLFVDRAYRLARRWSNIELARLAPLFTGDVVNVSAWDDRDKEGGHYRDYFRKAESYTLTNYGGKCGFQGVDNEYYLDLTKAVPEYMHRRFDVAFNHTTLEHIFDIKKAFFNLCELSNDVVIVVVPFVQVQHDFEEWKDYWRLTPTCLHRLFGENGLAVIYEAESPYKNSAVYLLTVGSRYPDRWEDRLPPYRPIHKAGAWVGRTLLWRLTEAALRSPRWVSLSRKIKGAKSQRATP